MDLNLENINGSWRNDACLGYCILALEQIGTDPDTIRRAVRSMDSVFDITTVEEATKYYINSSF